MATWEKDELRKISEADDLHIAPFREDGVTYGTPTWIWSVTVGHALYVQRLQRNRIALVSSRAAAKGRPYHRCRYDKGSGFRACRWFHQ